MCISANTFSFTEALHAPPPPPGFDIHCPSARPIYEGNAPGSDIYCSKRNQSPKFKSHFQAILTPTISYETTAWPTMQQQTTYLLRHDFGLYQQMNYNHGKNVLAKMHFY